MPVLRVSDLDDARLAEYRNIPDPELVRARGLFIAEGRLVVRRLLTGGRLRVRSLLVTDAALASLRDVVETFDPQLPIYVCSLPAIRETTGFDIHRGCLALAERPVEKSLQEVLRGANLVVVLEAVANADNVGGVFRNAAAFGADALLLSPGCCDPLYRKAIRTSMGAALQVPFARVADWPQGLEALRAEGLSLVALTPRPGALDIDAFAGAPDRPARLALVFGTEGAGLSAEAESYAAHRVRIPISAAVDSLNLATAAGIALYRLKTSSPENLEVGDRSRAG